MSVSPPHDEVEASPRDDVPEPGRACPRCGTPSEPDQEFCLECGLRLPTPPTGVIATLGGAWRRRFGWYPGDWMWLSLLALVVAALAGAGAAIFVAHDTGKSAATVVRTSPSERVTTTTPTAPTGTTPTSTRPGGTGTTTRTAPPPPPPPATTLRVWPAGRSGWTVILVSTLSRSSALDQAHRALRSGFTNVGILDSSRYPNLHPGYFVVFTGIFDSQAETGSALASARSRGYLSAYARRITP